MTLAPAAAARSAPRRRSPKGFTLVEVLVALFIMAVIAAMGWQGISTMARSREVAAAASERTLRLSALIGQWEQDLQAIYDGPLVPGVAFDGATLRLVRRVQAPDGGGVQVVAWTLRGDVWRRWTGPVLQRSDALQQSWLASFQLQGPEPGQLRLLDGLAGWQVFFWRGQGWSNAQSTGDLTVSATPPPPAAAGVAVAAPRVRLPGAVRLQLQLPEGTLTRDVALAPTQP